jgi:hypothetical protein
MATAQAAARSASSGRATGAPKRARMASPMNSSIVPWCAVMMSAMVPR